MNQKGFGRSIILISIAILVLIVGKVYYSGSNQNSNSDIRTTNDPAIVNSVIPTSDSSSLIAEQKNWKIYSNSALGFSFSYPTELNYIYDQFGFNHPDNPEGNLLLQNYDGSNPRKYQSTDFQMVIEAYKNSEQIGLDLYVKDPNKVWNQGGIQTFKSTTVGDLAALKGATVQKYEKTPTLWVSNKGFILTIYLGTPKSENADLFDKILETFKFSNSSSL